MCCVYVHRLFEVNVIGAFATTKAFMPLLRESRGRIVNVGSVSGLIATPGKGLYSASKFALEGATDSWRAELGAHFGISVSIASALLHSAQDLQTNRQHTQRYDNRVDYPVGALVDSALSVWLSVRRC